MSVVIKKTSKNLFDKSKVKNATPTETGFSFTNTNVTNSPTNIGTLRELCPDLKVGDRVTHYGSTVNSSVSSSSFFYLVGTKTDWARGMFITITEADLNGNVYAYGKQNMLCEYNNVIITKEANAPYEPYSAYSEPKELPSSDSAFVIKNGVRTALNKIFVQSGGVKKEVWTAKVTGVLFENGALTELGKKYITSVTASKTHKPPAYGAYSTTNYDAVKLSKALNLKISWTVQIGNYTAQYDKFEAKLNGTQIYYFEDGGSGASSDTRSGTTSLTNISTVPASISCGNNVSIQNNYITLTITKIEAV